MPLIKCEELAVGYDRRAVLSGLSFAVAEGEDRMYFACIIKDATQCCANGIEFVWEGDHSYPADYPAEGAEITVVGDFDVYYEGVQRYVQLVNARLSF